MPAEAQPLVSVITPVYNGADHLAEAIDSVLAQSYENWNYVISDNASTDRTREIALDYASRDERIRIVTHREHVGLLQSWNRSVKLIADESAYMKVLHADDWLFPACLEKMVAVAELNPSVGIVGSYRLAGSLVDLDGIPYDSPVVSGRELVRGRLVREQYPFVFGSPSSLMFRSDLVRERNPFYDESNLHADTGVCYDILLESDFGFVHQVLTYTRRHQGAFTAYTKRVGTYKPLHLEHLLDYGPACLTRRELEEQIGIRVAAYLRFLARRPHRFRDSEFRDFHVAALSRLQDRVTAGEVGRGLALRIRRKLALAARVLPN